MTPSINRLAESAEIVGVQIMEQEWDFVREEFALNRPESFEAFKEWLGEYTYYYCVVCACGGQSDAIDDQLRDDYDELVDTDVSEPSTAFAA
jgi:hypothetical protein